MARLVACLNRLPGIGKRSAERIAFHLLKASTEEAMDLARAIEGLKLRAVQCSRCHNLADMDPCAICSDPRRDASVLLVVEQPQDVATLESLGSFGGGYHVLMGRLSPLEGLGPGELTAEALLARAQDGAVREVILGTSPTAEGDGTALWLADQLKRRAPGVAVTRLARGLPTGANLEAVGKAVLGDALHARQRVG